MKTILLNLITLSLFTNYYQGTAQAQQVKNFNQYASLEFIQRESPALRLSYDHSLSLGNKSTNALKRMIALSSFRLGIATYSIHNMSKGKQSYVTDVFEGSLGLATKTPIADGIGFSSYIGLGKNFFTNKDIDAKEYYFSEFKQGIFLDNMAQKFNLERSVHIETGVSLKSNFISKDAIRVLGNKTIEDYSISPYLSLSFSL